MILSCEVSPEELSVFMEEADEHLRLLGEDIVKLGSKGSNQHLLQEIFRSAHTLKGSSSMLGHQRMAEVTHAMEGLLERLRNNKTCINSGTIDVLLSALDALKALKSEAISNSESYVDVQVIISRLNGLVEGLAEGGSKHGSVPHDSDRTRRKSIIINRNTEDKLAEARREGLNIYVVKTFITAQSEWTSARNLQIYNDLSLMGRIISSVPSIKDIEQERDDHEFTAIVCCQRGRDQVVEKLQLIADIVRVEVAPYESDKGNMLIKDRWDIAERDALAQKIQPWKNRLETAALEAASKREAPQTMRVDVTALNNLVNTVDELIVYRSCISQIGKMLETKYPKDEIVCELVDTSNRMTRVINESYKDIMKVRMVPVSQVFCRLPRLVRDLAKKLHKDVDFVISGEGTELNRNVADKMRDPLVHLLRNAVDHGIENWKDRKAKGKPEKGLIRLSVLSEGGHIVIRVEDDGRGIDPRKVKASAVGKGFISAKGVARLSDAEVIDLVFLPGISTLEKTTDVSGRGVGLDIVKTEIERMSGNVSVETIVDKGTVFVIKLPITVDAFHGRRPGVV